MSEPHEGGRASSDDWSVPPELRNPTASVISNLTIIMISSEMLGNDAIAAVGEFQAESARFNRWCGGVGIKLFPVVEISRRNFEARKIARRTYEAWVSFSEKFEAGHRKIWVATDERAALLEALIEAKYGLAVLQESDSE